MASKVRAAVRARRDPDFVIVARTDARSVEGFDAAVRRAREYLAAGADMIFPEALESADEFARFKQEVDAPLLANMTEFGRSPLLPFEELAGLGYKAVIYPLTRLASGHARGRRGFQRPCATREHNRACSNRCRPGPSSTTCSAIKTGKIAIAATSRPIRLNDDSTRLNLLLARGACVQGLDRGDVQERTDLEFRGHAVIRDIDADENARPGQQRHLGMANLVSLAARHHQSERPERPRGQQISKSLDRHMRLSPGVTNRDRPLNYSLRAWSFATCMHSVFARRETPRQRGPIDLRKSSDTLDD